MLPNVFLPLPTTRPQLVDLAHLLETYGQDPLHYLRHPCPLSFCDGICVQQPVVSALHGTLGRQCADALKVLEGVPFRKDAPVLGLSTFDCLFL